MSRLTACLLVALLGLASEAVAQEDELVNQPPQQIEPFEEAQQAPDPAPVPTPPAPEAEEPSPAESILADPAEAARIELEREREAGKTNLVLGQSMQGTMLGVELALLLTPAENDTSAAAILVGGGLGFVAGLAVPLAAVDGIDPGHAAALNSGPFWGWLLGFTAARTNYSIGHKGRLGVSILTQAAGLGAAQLAWHLFQPTRGQVTLVDSVAGWSFMFGTLALVAEASWDFPQRRPIVAGTHFWTTSIGLAGGGILAAANPRVRGARVMFINLGGIVGGLLAPIVGSIAVGVNERDAALLGMAGAAAGMGLSALLTRNMAPGQRRPPRLSMQLSPSIEGRPTIGFGGHF